MTINPVLFPQDPSIQTDSNNKTEMYVEYEHFFDDLGPDASSRFFLGDGVLAEIDSALTSFAPVMRTRKDFMYVATLWALECIKADPNMARRKLASTGAVAQGTAKDNRDGNPSRENHKAANRRSTK